MSSAPGQQLIPPPVAATVHIYRGLMDRATTWRIRIDVTTNWAIVTSGTAVGFVLDDQSYSHAVLLLVMVFTLAFLIIETRRMRFYDLWGSWVRLLETAYFAPILRDNSVGVNEVWQQIMVRDMADPHFKATMLQLIGRRLRDNYLAIYLFLLLAWLLKLALHPRANLPPTATLVDYAAVGPVPGWLVFAGVICFYTAMLVIALVMSYAQGPSIEVLSSERTMQKLASPAQQRISRQRWDAGALWRTINDSDRTDPID